MARGSLPTTGCTPWLTPAPVGRPAATTRYQRVGWRLGCASPPSSPATTGSGAAGTPPSTRARRSTSPPCSSGCSWSSPVTSWSTGRAPRLSTWGKRARPRRWTPTGAARTATAPGSTRPRASGTPRSRSTSSLGGTGTPRVRERSSFLSSSASKRAGPFSTVASTSAARPWGSRSRTPAGPRYPPSSKTRRLNTTLSASPPSSRTGCW
mmetsp:Transcript_14126/g.34388  ORF Transcript_14126/g.34388 Transcript_14126/m.34388 type:complete len:209 (-) Transcript_14126:1328-1954(-)